MARISYEMAGIIMNESNTLKGISASGIVIGKAFIYSPKILLFLNIQ